MPTSPVSLDAAATPVTVSPGGEIVFHGSYHSTLDASVVDPAATTDSQIAQADMGGLFDFEGGGLHVVSHDAKTHEVHAIATGEAAPACALAHVASPCLPSRIIALAQSRLVTSTDFRASLKGSISYELVDPPATAPAAAAATKLAPIFGVGAAIALVVVIASAIVKGRRRKRASPEGQLDALVARLTQKLAAADAELAGPLEPAVRAASEALRKKRLAADSPQRKRIVASLEAVEAKLDETEKGDREAREQAIASEILRDVESAIEAADEARSLELRAPRP